jgi:hypothetical protein
MPRSKRGRLCADALLKGTGLSFNRCDSRRKVARKGFQVDLNRFKEFAISPLSNFIVELGFDTGLKGRLT